MSNPYRAPDAVMVDAADSAGESAAMTDSASDSDPAYESDTLGRPQQEDSIRLWRAAPAAARWASSAAVALERNTRQLARLHTEWGRMARSSATGPALQHPPGRPYMDGETCLMYLVSEASGAQALRFLERGADPFAVRWSDGNTVMHAFAGNSALRFSGRYDTDPLGYACARQAAVAATMAGVLSALVHSRPGAPELLCRPNRYGDTPMTVAAGANASMAQLLLQCMRGHARPHDLRSHLDHQNTDGDAALHLILDYPHRSKRSTRLSCFQTNRDDAAAAFRQDEDSEATPETHAMRCTGPNMARVDVFEALLRAGCSVDTRNSRGMSVRSMLREDSSDRHSIRHHCARVFERMGR